MWRRRYNEDSVSATVQEQLTYIGKGLAELIREQDLRERILLRAREGKPLRVKAGFDPRTRSSSGACRSDSQAQTLSGHGPSGDLPDWRFHGNDRRSDGP